jgi:hypothetical protein
MRVISLEPMKPGKRTDLVLYRCPKCETETTRQHKRE